MPRTQEETRLLIADTLDTLLATQPISKIKVANLCDEAGISRTAFYRYFDSVEDVPKWLWERIFSETAGGAAELINRSTFDGVVERALCYKGKGRPTDAELLQVRFFNEGAVALTRAWLVGELNCSPEAMSACLMSMVPAFWEKCASAADAFQ